MEPEHPLTVADHTRVMKAVLDRPLNIIHYLETPKGSRPTPEQVLDAALKVRAFDPEIRAVLLRVRQLHPEIEAAKSQLPQQTLNAAEGVVEKARGKSVDEVLAMLATEREQSDVLAPVLETAELVFQDGADTIYSPDYAPAEYLQDLGTTFDLSPAGEAIGIADLTGVVLGGLGKGLVGAIAGGVAASAGGAITVVVIEVLS